MSKQNEIIRLKQKGLSERAIARVLKCSRNTVKQYFENNANHQEKIIHTPLWVAQLDWNKIYLDYRAGVPLNVLWEERFEINQIPTQYSGFWKQFCQKFPSTKDATMIRSFRPGERVEVDYCDGIDILDAATGEIIPTHLFMGVLCNSRYAFAEFTFTQKSLDFLSSHVRMFEYFGGVPATVAPDNLKSAVTKAHPYDPEKNQAYVRLAQYYDITVTPARVKRPKDKALVERTIQIFQKWFYFRVRKRTFTSLVELNTCLQEYLRIFNEKKHRVFQQSRAQMFAQEKEFLMSLPQVAYQVAIHKKATLHSDCHLEFEKVLYSAPHEYRGFSLDVWASDRQLEIGYEGQVIAVHARSYNRGGHRTNYKHYPPAHQAYLEITPSYLRDKADTIGPSTYEVINKLLSTKYPLRYLRRAQGILALAKSYSPKQLELACVKSLEFDRYAVPFIENLIIRDQIHYTEQSKIQRLPNPHVRGESLFN